MSDDAKKVIQEHFGKTAHNYAAASIHMQGEDLQWLVKALPLSGNERVLDAGTGAGPVSFAFAPHVKYVEGIDITPRMLEIAAQTARTNELDNVQFREADIENLPHDNDSFDIVVSRWCAHHYTDIRKAVAEVARVLRPGGAFLLADSIAPENPRTDTFLNTLEILRDTGHVRNYRIAEWLDYLERVGLHGTVLKEWQLRLDVDDWVKRIQTPETYVRAIVKLLDEADKDLKTALQITDSQSEQGAGFHLPAVLLKAHLVE